MTFGAGVMGAAGATMVDTIMATVIMARATAVRPNIQLHFAGVTCQWYVLNGWLLSWRLTQLGFAGGFNIVIGK